MKLEPVGYIGTDAFEAISGGESIQPTMTPKAVCEDDAPLYAIPPGYVLVKSEPKYEDLFRAWVKVANGTIDDIDRFQAAYKAMIEGGQ